MVGNASSVSSADCIASAVAAGSCQGCVATMADGPPRLRKLPWPTSARGRKRRRRAVKTSYQVIARRSGCSARRPSAGASSWESHKPRKVGPRAQVATRAYRCNGDSAGPACGQPLPRKSARRCAVRLTVLARHDELPALPKTQLVCEGRARRSPPDRRSSPDGPPRRSARAAPATAVG